VAARVAGAAVVSAMASSSSSSPSSSSESFSYLMKFSSYEVVEETQVGCTLSRVSVLTTGSNRLIKCFDSVGGQGIDSSWVVGVVIGLAFPLMFFRTTYVHKIEYR
jgi:hypothetical protein